MYVRSSYRADLINLTETRQTDLTGHDGGKVLLFVHQHQVFERPRLEEEGVSLLQRHRRGELRLLVVVAQVSDLVEITEGIRGRVSLVGEILQKRRMIELNQENLLVSKL